MLWAHSLLFCLEVLVYSSKSVVVLGIKLSSQIIYYYTTLIGGHKHWITSYGSS